MKNLITSILLFLCFTVSAQVTSKVTSFGMPYLEFKNPDVQGPVILFLHGAGECGNGGAELNKLYNAGLPRVLKLSGKTTIDGFAFIVAPQQVCSKQWGTDIVKIVQWYYDNYSQARDYGLFVTGLSMGGLGTWVSSYTSAMPDSLVTGIVPVSGAGDYNGGKTTAKRGIPVWALHGKADYSAPNTVTDGQRPINGMNSCNPKPDPAPIFTLITGGTHSNNTWDKVYSLTPRTDCPEMGGITIYEWMLKYRKQIPDNSGEKIPPKISYFDTGENKFVVELENGQILKFSPD